MGGELGSGRAAYPGGRGLSSATGFLRRRRALYPPGGLAGLPRE